MSGLKLVTELTRERNRAHGLMLERDALRERLRIQSDESTARGEEIVALRARLADVELERDVTWKLLVKRGRQVEEVMATCPTCGDMEIGEDEEQCVFCDDDETVALLEELDNVR